MKTKQKTIIPVNAALAVYLICAIGLVASSLAHTSFAATIGYDYDLDVEAGQSIGPYDPNKYPDVPPGAVFDASVPGEAENNVDVNATVGFQIGTHTESYDYWGGSVTANLYGATGNAMIGKLRAGTSGSAVATHAAGTSQHRSDTSTAKVVSNLDVYWQDKVRLVAPFAGPHLLDIDARIILEGQHGAGAVGTAPNYAYASTAATVATNYGSLTGAFDGVLATANPPSISHSPDPYREVISTGIQSYSGATTPLFVELGDAVEIDLTSSSNAEPPGEVSGFAISNFTGTALWGGIVSVTDDVTGEPVENWTITSESGFDYSKPYPVSEPASASLLVFSLVGFVGIPKRTAASGAR